MEPIISIYGYFIALYRSKNDLQELFYVSLHYKELKSVFHMEPKMLCCQAELEKVLLWHEMEVPQKSIFMTYCAIIVNVKRYFYGI